jgi:hypothetical protein
LTWHVGMETQNKGAGMRRIALLAAPLTVAVGLFASTASAAPSGSSSQTAAGSVRSAGIAREVTEFEANYNAPEYYGEVHCVGKHIVSNKFPNGKDVEKCYAVTPPLAHMTAGKGQTTFENSNGELVSGWNSDYNGALSTNFTYNVSANLSKFALKAIY